VLTQSSGDGRLADPAFAGDEDQADVRHSIRIDATKEG
jgi:hypothetical protein